MSIRFLGFLVLVAGCSSGEPAPPASPARSVDPGSLPTLRVFFGHQSVGRDILTGIAEVAPEIRVTPVEDTIPEGGVLMEASVGQNQRPETKDRAFLEALSRLGPVDLAFYKYCYIDVGTDTDPDELFGNYVATLDEARSGGVRVIPVTIPLTTVEPAWKRRAKEALGRTTQAALNAKRMRFNERLREHFAGQIIVDVARLESTRTDGTRSLIRVGGQSVESLDPGFTYDGSHLNERGRRHVAAGVVTALSAACP